MHRARWIKAYGQQYKQMNAVVIGITDGYPQFGVIQDFYITDCLNLLAVKAYETVAFIEHFHGYEVKPTSSSQEIFINICSLIDPHVLVIHHLAHIQKYVIVLKYHICSTIC